MPSAGDVAGEPGAPGAGGAGGGRELRADGARDVREAAAAGRRAAQENLPQNRRNRCRCRVPPAGASRVKFKAFSSRLLGWRNQIVSPKLRRTPDLHSVR